MTFSNETKSLLQSRYEQLPPALASLIDGGRIDEFATAMQSRFDFDAEKAALLSNELAMVTLLYEPISDLAKNLQKNLDIPAKMASEIARESGNKLFNDTQPLIEAFNDSQIQEDSELVEANQTLAAGESNESEEVKPLRTMDSDAKNIHGYGINRTAVAAEEAVDDDETLIHSSSQDSLMPKPKEVIEQPPTTETEPEADTSK